VNELERTLSLESLNENAANLPEELAELKFLRSLESLCGPDDMLDVELYNETLGVTKEFVFSKESPVAQIQWNDDLVSRYGKGAGNVAGKRWCTGTLIARDQFLTAGHCFQQQNDPFGWVTPSVVDGNARRFIEPGEIATNMHVNFKYQVNKDTLTIRDAEQFPISELLEYGLLQGIDYAILRLGPDDGNRLPGDVFGVTSVAIAPNAAGTTLTVLQHPAGRPKKIEAGIATDVTDVAVTYGDIDTLGGSSGSGVLNNKGELIAVHIEGGCGPTSGSNLAVSIKRIAEASTIVSTLVSGQHEMPNSAEGADFPLGGEQRPSEADPVELDPDQLGADTSIAPEPNPQLPSSEQGIPPELLESLPVPGLPAGPLAPELNFQSPGNAPSPEEQEVDPEQLGFQVPNVANQGIDKLFLASTSAEKSKSTQASYLSLAQAAPTRQTDAPVSTCAKTFPFELRRSISFWRLTDDAKACSDAVKDIRSLRAMMQSETRDDLRETKLFMPDYICQDEMRHRRTIVQRYTEHCLYRLAEANEVGILSAENKELILSQSGEILGIDQQCIGTISDSKVYTSKHCFLKATKEHGIELVVPPSGISLRTFSGKLIPLQTRDGSVAPPNMTADSDWIALSIDQQADIPVRTIKLRPDLAGEWRPVMLLAPHRYLRALGACGAGQREEDISNTLVLDITPGCTIFAREGDLVYHGCQTQKGMSGTPLLTLADGELALVAIHAGPSDVLSTPYAKELSARFPNYAVIPQQQ